MDPDSFEMSSHIFPENNITKNMFPAAVVFDAVFDASTFKMNGYIFRVKL